MTQSEIPSPSIPPANTPPSTPILVADTAGPSGRWWWGVAAGFLIATPLAWLLSYAAALPFFLGLFFFMLFGLMIGAAVFRVASPARPFGMSPLLVGTSLLVAWTFGLSLWKEARDFPEDLARRVVSRTKDIGDRTAGEFRALVAADVHQFLSSRYGPGSSWGYVRWVLTDGQISKGDLATVEKGLSMPVAQTRIWWAFRVVASIALLGFGIASQTLTLQTTRRHRADEEHSNTIR